MEGESGELTKSCGRRRNRQVRDRGTGIRLTCRRKLGSSFQRPPESVTEYNSQPQNRLFS